MEKENSSWVCPKCNTENKSENKFCSACGESFETSGTSDLEVAESQPPYFSVELVKYILLLVVLSVLIFIAIWGPLYAECGEWLSQLGDAAMYIAIAFVIFSVIVASIFMLSFLCLFKFVIMEKYIKNIQAELNELKNNSK